MDTSKTWLITGAGRGFGRALALAAHAAGDRVVATVRGTHDLPEDDERMLLYHLDVRDRRGAQAAVAQTVKTFERLDVVVNNAGYGLVGAVEEADEEQVRSIINTDLLGAIWITQAALPVLREQGSGHIVQISTVGAVGAMPLMGFYNAAKWGLEGFSEALAGEVREHNIRVTIAELGSIDTEWATTSMRFAAPPAGLRPVARAAVRQRRGSLGDGGDRRRQFTGRGGRGPDRSYRRSRRRSPAGSDRR